MGPKIREPAREEHEEMFAFHVLFNEGGTTDDRATAIVGAAFLDGILERTLFNFMVDDGKEATKLVEGGLGTFSNRIAATYCLGLICKTVRDDLRTIGRIRNKFAHEVHTSFDQESIRTWCLALRWHEFSMMTKTPTEASPLEIFKVSVNQLSGYLSGLAGVRLLERRKICEDDSGGPTLLR
jgi:hypothetical protein